MEDLRYRTAGGAGAVAGFAEFLFVRAHCFSSVAWSSCRALNDTCDRGYRLVLQEISPLWKSRHKSAQPGPRNVPLRAGSDRGVLP